MDLCSSSSTMMSCASKRRTTGAGSLMSDNTNPGFNSSSEMSLSLTRTFSPPTAYDTSFSSRLTDSTTTRVRLGMRRYLPPSFIVPCSTLPSTHVPMSRYLSMIGSRSGASGFRSSGGSSSSSSMNDLSAYQGHVPTSMRDMTLAPLSAEMGAKTTSFFMLYPHCLRKGVSFSMHSLYRSSAHSTVGSSILLITTTSMRTPSVFASSACSRVCPPRSNPVSNSPLRAEMTSTPMSAWHAPAIMLGT
mmetsp:Transcript_2128/g.5455  ORF Transcript_2128/g.5455 Transcript_2128/m.5455 type:complete len:246 (-) Transcript_2128:844-1581(-)